MSESFPPPDPAAPPPGAPEGYAAYTPTNWGQGLSRIQPLALWITILLAVSALASLVSIGTSMRAFDAAEDYLAGRIDEDAFQSDIGATTFGGLIVSAVTVALVVLSIIWLHRIARNHRAIGRQLRWSPGWAIGGWFLPPLVLYIIPLLVLRESWQASDPQSPPGSTNWKSKASDDPRLWVWWVIYGLTPILFIAIGASQLAQITSTDAQELAEYYDEQRPFVIAQAVIGVVSAVAWFVVVRGLTARHTQLTEESSARR